MVVLLVVVDVVVLREVAVVVEVEVEVVNPDSDWFVRRRIGRWVKSLDIG